MSQSVPAVNPDTKKKLRCGHIFKTQALIQRLLKGRFRCSHCYKIMFFPRDGDDGINSVCQSLYYPCFLIKGQIYFANFEGTDDEYGFPVKLVGLDDGREMGWGSNHQQYDCDIFKFTLGDQGFSFYFYF